MTDAPQGLEPKLLWELFAQIAAIPHGSGDEAALAAHLAQVAENAGLQTRRDAAGSLLVSAPATPGYEDAPTVVLQGHLDMVCEKNADVEFDFARDGIRLRRDGQWLRAHGTTLGADNGIGVAAGLAAALDETVVHGPLEILLTIDEESGLTGARQLEPDLIEGRVLLNLDSEEPGALYVGCAGGAGVEITLPLEFVTPGPGTGVRLTVKGLRGGHSGIDIIDNRGSAVKLLARLLRELTELGVAVADIAGGDKHNAIPREASALVAIAEGQVDAVTKWVGALAEEFRHEFPADENLAVEMALAELPTRVLAGPSQAKAVALIVALPHGVLAMSRDVAGLVETSNNVAAVRIAGEALVAANSPRSSNDAAMQGVIAQIAACGELAGAAVAVDEGYPGWQPNLASPIVKLAEAVHQEVHGKAPAVKAIHAGLECGIIGEKVGGMDMVSFGPWIQNPHSPDERVHIGSVADFWEFLKALLAAVAEGRLV